MIKVSSAIEEEIIEKIEDLLFEIAPHSWTLNFDHSSNKNSLIGYFDNLVNAKKSIKKFKTSIECSYSFKFNVERIKDEDWKNSYKKHFKPWNVDDFHFVPAWLNKEYLVPKKHKKIYIDPGMAFGTGNHETTKLCLYSILKFSNSCENKRIIDIGCGSGIIALTASKLGYKNIHAIDHDEEAVINSIQNAKINKINDVTFKNTSIEEIDINKHYDVVIANIQSDVLISNAITLTKIVERKGIMILSGILKDEANLLQDKFKQILDNKQTKFVLRSIEMNEWNLTEIRYLN